MSAIKPQNHRGRSFFFYSLIAMVLLTVIVVGLLTLNIFFTTNNLIEETSAHAQNQTEQNIIATIRLLDASFTLFDNSLNSEMNHGLERVMQEYERSGKNPAKMDLAAVRKNLGESFDIYIINESGVIEYTTYQPELGVDFKTIPYFYEYLTKIRMSEGFFPDRVVKEKEGNGPFRKYAYMPTPDHRYILELGLNGSAFRNERSVLNYQEIISSIAVNNPSIERIRTYDMTKHLSGNASYVPDAALNATLNTIINSRKGMVTNDPKTGKSVTYLFIDLKNTEYGSDLSRIVEITYNRTFMDTVLFRQFTLITLIAFSGLLVGLGAAFIISRSLSQPITGIVNGADRIARGDLNHKIAPTDVAEFQVIEQSINHMMTSLQEAFDKIRESEAALKASERKYHDLYLFAPIALFEINLTSKTIVSGNQYLCDIFGINSPDEVIGTSIFKDYVTPLALEEAWALLSRDGFFDGHEMQFRNPATGKVFWGEVSIRVKNDRDLAEGSIVDITARKGAEAELRTLYNELETRITERTAELKTAQEAYRRANAKLNLLNSVTRHDVLNQLTVLNGYLSLVETEITTPDSQIHEFFKRAEQAARNIERQIVFTKMYQDIGVHAPTWQNVEGLINKAKTGLLPNTISLTLNLDNLEIYADPLLEKTFYTLLENAMRHGIKVTEIRFSYHINGDETLHLICEDNGIGISIEDKKHIFERGYGKHTGFGLFLARETLSITGLRITETGEPGKGARFVITVPKEGYRFAP